MQQKVFISSRMKELSEERKTVEEAVSELWTHENLPFTIWGWEDAKEIPSGKHPDKVQSKGVRDSDIYLLILGSEYGDFEYRESPTHKEYDVACSEREEECILIYIKEVGRRREEKLEKWIEEIKNRHTFKSFKNPDQLKDLVKTRLRDLWNKGKWKADIPTIQSTLRKGEALEGDFFKKEPEWIDFEEGFVVERREVDEIIKKLENDNIQLVLGEPASGKSVILKHIGFKLAKENKDVYVVELKKHSKDEIKRYFDDIFKIKDGKAVFIVDDAHLLPSECERLVREFKNRKLKAKLIIGSRPTREIRGEHPKEASVFEYLNKTDIHAEDVTEEIIKTFLKRKYGFSDERIERVSKNLEEYKKDLWHLSWALKAYNPEKDSMEEKEIYERVKDSIRDINAEDVFLSLSIFYRFEIPIERYFLEEQLGIEEDKINQLIELSEIIETEEEYRMLSLNHSSIAELYFKTYQLYRDLGRRITKKILNQRDEDLECCLFYKYMTSTHTKNAVDIVIHLGGDWLNEKGGIALQKKLIDDKKIQRSIKEVV
jgi:energy-coupling factor transporter ATP-binding protein EcfA2